MIRATVGTWLNYGTTLAFQVIFAGRFGATSAAVAFVIAFGLMAGLSGIVGSTVQTVAVPRVLDAGGRIRTGAMKFMALVAICTFVITRAIAVGASEIAVWFQRAGVGNEVFASLLRWAALATVLQLLATELGAVALARGSRFAPAIAPAAPTTIMAAVMLLRPHLVIADVYALFVLGSIVQALTVAVFALRRSQLSNDRLGKTGGAAVAMLLSYVVLALIVPIDRVLAALHNPADAAHYDYAVRSLMAVQKLIVGGLMLSAIADWSRLVRAEDRVKLADSLAGSFLTATLILVLSASIAMVAGHDIVAAVYQRGSFTASDTSAVTVILIVALPGFAAEAAAMVITQAFASTRHNYVLAAIGATHFALRTTLAVILAIEVGAVGVAAAYSITNVFLLLLLLLLAARYSFWPKRGSFVWRGVAVALGTGAVAVALAAGAGEWPSVFSAAIVVAVFAVLFGVFRPVRGITLRVG